MHVRVKLTIFPSPRGTFFLRITVWEKEGGTGRQTDGSFAILYMDMRYVQDFVAVTSLDDGFQQINKTKFRQTAEIVVPSKSDCSFM
jgi:hypothetical protein